MVLPSAIREKKAVGEMILYQKFLTLLHLTKIGKEVVNGSVAFFYGEMLILKPINLIFIREFYPN